MDKDRVSFALIKAGLQQRYGCAYGAACDNMHMLHTFAYKNLRLQYDLLLTQVGHITVPGGAALDEDEGIDIPGGRSACNDAQHFNLS